MRVVRSANFISKLNLWDKRTGRNIKFDLWPRQRDFLSALHSKRNIIVLKKRQVGLSQLTGADSLAQCAFQPNFTVLVLSEGQDAANEYLNRIKSMWASVPSEFRELVCPSPRSDRIEFVHGSRIISLSAKGGSGYTADRVIIDEAAKITPSRAHISLDEVLENVAPTLDKSGGQLVVISTAKGFGTYRKLYRGAPDNGYFPFFFSCYDDPTFSEADRALIVTKYGNRHANQEYPRTDSEAFLSNSAAVFEGTEKLVALPPISEDYPLKIYSEPDPDAQYVCGADCAAGHGSDGDFSVGYIIDNRTWQICAVINCRYQPDLFAAHLVSLCERYNNAFLGVEVDGPGLAVLQFVKQSYGNFYQRTVQDSVSGEIVKKIGWSTNRKTKDSIISQVKKCILDGSVTAVPAELIAEMETFVSENGEVGAISGYHDDHVMAFSIALQMIHENPYIDYTPRKTRYMAK